MSVYIEVDKQFFCSDDVFGMWQLIFFCVLHRVGLLAFHQTLVSFPQDAFVVWVFASVLYHGQWNQGVKFAREHANEQVKFVPEFSGFSEIKSDEQLAEKVAQLASSVQDCVNGLTATESGYVSTSNFI